VLGGDERSVTLLLAVFTIGIGLGSMLCDRLSGRRVEIGLVPFGAIGLSLFGVDLLFASPALLPAGAPLLVSDLLGRPEIWRVLVDLLGVGVFGGFFIVPLYVLIQVRSAPQHRARIIATNNIMNALFMVVGALGAGSLLGHGLSIPRLFALAAGGNALVMLLLICLEPDYRLRFMAWLKRLPAMPD
jgi:MFS family permease